jgi:shikimate dehydrogenase
MSSSALQEITALLGCPAAGQPDQYLFERAFAAAGLDWRFLTLDVAEDHLQAALRGAAALRFRGCLLSGPLRGLATDVVDELSPAAAFACGVSMVDTRQGKLVGHMTEGRGVVEAVRRHAEPASKPVLVAGGGIAAKATALEMALAGSGRIVVTARSPEQAEALCDAIRGLEQAAAETLPWADPLPIPDDVGVVVAAVPQASDPPLTFSGWRGDLVVADLALVSQPSRLLAEARRHGACCVDGLDIRSEKNAIDFQSWTDRDADPDMLREAIDEFLNA